jgi:hypothetical protein
MTRSNRLLNRLFVAIVGLALVAIGAWEANRVYPVVAIVELDASTSAVLWMIAATCLVVAVLSIAWIVSRGRGHSRAVVSRTDDTGETSINARVAADFIADDLKLVADVVSVASRAYRIKGSIALELTVTTRRAADVRHVVDSVRRAVEELDDVLEERIPVLLHVASGVRANFAREQRVH